MRLLLGVISLVFLLLGCKEKADQHVTVAAYMLQNRSSILTDDQERLEDLYLLGDDLENEVFIAGETHEVHGNDRLAAMLFRYLHKYANVRYYMLELPPQPRHVI